MKRLLLKKSPCYDATIIFIFNTVLERRIVWCIKSRTRLFTNLLLISRFSRQLYQGVLYKAEIWHALSQEQYFSKQHFLYICQCVFNLELAKKMIKPPLIWQINLMYNFISCQWIDIITLFSSFDINCKILTLMWKTSGILILGQGEFSIVFRGVSFPYFPKVALDNLCVFGRVEPLLLFRGFVDHVTIFNWSYMQQLIAGNYCWQLLHRPLS